MPRPPPWVLVLLGGLAAALLVLWPGILQPTSVLIGHESIDVWSHAWGLHWFTESLAEGRLPWVVEGAAWPERRVLWYIDPIGALLTAPLQLGGPALAWNGLLAMQVTALFVAGHAWGRSLGGSGWLAGAALATTPCIQGELWNGVNEAVWLAPVALAGWAAARRKRWTGVAAGVALIATPYHGLGAALLVATVLLMGGSPTREGPRPGVGNRLAELVLAGFLAALVAGPFLWALAQSVASTEAFVNRPLAGGWNEPTLLSNAVDPRALVKPGDFWSVASEGGANGIAWRRTPYLGLTLLALAVVGLIRRPRLWPLLVPLLVGLVATLGHFLWFDGAWVRTPEGGRYILPLGSIRQAAGITLEHPMRFVGSAIVVLAGLADAGLTRLGRWGTWSPIVLVPLVVVEHLMVAPNAWPLAASPAALPAVHAALPDDGLAVVDLPADSGFGMRTDRYLYWNAIHDRPVPWNNRVGSTGTASMNDALRTMVLLSKRDTPVPGTPGVPAADADLDAALEELVEHGLGYVIVHPGLFEKDRQGPIHRKALTSLMGGPPQELEGAWVGTVGDGRAPAGEPSRSSAPPSGPPPGAR